MKIVLSLILLLSASIVGSAAVFEEQIQPKSGDNFTEARFRLWLPEKVQRVQGVFVLVPGYQGDGLNLIDEPRWQELAAKWNFGVLGCTLRDGKGNYYLADKGTGRALLEALAKLAADTDHPELKDSPLAMWGHSAGGQFNYNFTSWLPERVIAFVAVKGAYYQATPDARSRSVPALFFIGEKDEVLRIKNITAVFQTNRRQGAVWCVAVEPNQGHGIGRTLDLALPFFDAVIPLRMDPKKPTRLRSVNDTAVWLGNPSSNEVAAMANYSQPRSEAVWLPNEATALKWKEFVGQKPLAATDSTTSVPASASAAPKLTPALIATVPLVIGLIFLSIRLHKHRSSPSS
jgi:dienelactone hydrolase